jgi:hypothetical protein
MAEDSRRYYDESMSAQLKSIRTRAFVCTESLHAVVKNVRTALPDWGQVLSHLDVSQNEISHLEEQLSSGDVILRQVAVPMHDVREHPHPGVPDILDCGEKKVTVIAEFALLEDSTFNGLSNTKLNARRTEYNRMVDSMASESKKCRRHIENSLRQGRKQRQAELTAAAVAAGVSSSSSSSSFSSSSSSSSSSSTLLGKRQRASMEQGLAAFNFMKGT